TQPLGVTRARVISTPGVRYPSGALYKRISPHTAAAGVCGAAPPITIWSPEITAPESTLASPLITGRVRWMRPATETVPLRTATSPRHSLPRGSRERPTRRVVVGAL